MRIFEEYKELNSSVEYEFEKGDAHCSFIAKEIVGFSEGKNGQYDVPSYHDEAQEDCDFEHAENLIRGFIKWDWCGHFRFGDKEGYLHVCGENDADMLAELVVKIKNRCAEIMKDGGVTMLD